MRVCFAATPGALEPYYGDFLDAIGNRHEVALYDYERSAAEQLENVGVVVDFGGGNGTPEMIDAAADAGVKLWQIIGTGVDHVDIDRFLRRGLPLANTPGIFSAVALAEHALFLMLHFAKNYSESAKNVRSGVFFPPPKLNDELAGLTLGLIGFGASGQALAARAAALGMRVTAFDTALVGSARADGVDVELSDDREGFERVLSEADYLSVHVPLTPETRHLIDARAFGLMKETAVLINVARGRIVDEDALLDALRSGRIRGAGLDVFAHEPLPPESPLLRLQNVVATPHVAAQTKEASRRRARAAAENVERVSQGLPPLYEIRAPGWGTTVLPRTGDERM